MQACRIVATRFVNTYYSALAYEPDQLAALYSSESIASIGRNLEEPVIAEGKENIAKAFSELGLNGALTNLENGTVDSVSCGKSGVTILVTGTLLLAATQELRHFTHTFVLLRDFACVAGDRFFVASEVLRLTDFAIIAAMEDEGDDEDATDSEYEYESDEEGEEAPAAERQGGDEAETKATQEGQEPVQEPAQEHVQEQEPAQGEQVHAEESEAVAEQESMQEQEPASEQEQVPAAEDAPEPEAGSVEQETATEEAMPKEEEATGSDAAAPAAAAAEEEAAPAPVRPKPTSWSKLFVRPKDTRRAPEKQQQQQQVAASTAGPAAAAAQQGPARSGARQEQKGSAAKGAGAGAASRAAKGEEEGEFMVARSRKSRSRVDAHPPEVFVRYRGEASEKELQKVLEEFGYVSSLRLNSNIHAAYVEFVEGSSAKQAIAASKAGNLLFNGSTLTVELRKSSFAGPRSGGRPPRDPKATKPRE